MEVKLLCQHCGNQGIHTVVATVTETETIELEPGNSFEEDFEIVFCRCENCDQHSLFSFLNGNSDESWSLYPREKQIDDSVPKGIRDAYSEALKIKKISSIAFVIMIRRALELLCKHEGAKGNDLSKKIQDLGRKEIIPKVLSEMADTIRLIGNDNAHDDKKTLDFHELELLDNFYSTIIEYVYIGPKKIELLKKKLEK